MTLTLSPLGLTSLGDEEELALSPRGAVTGESPSEDAERDSACVQVLSNRQHVLG